MHQGTLVESSQGCGASPGHQPPPDQSIGGTQIANGRARIVTRHVNELRPHPSFLRHCLSVPIAAISAVGSQVAPSLQEPLVISQEQIILDGYAQWELARLQGRLTVPCIEYELGEEEALHRLIQSHRRSQGLNDFARILLALDLEPWLQERARFNQRTGGQTKGLSTLAKAPRLDVRSEIAAAAGVSTGNVTKVKQLVQAAHPNILQALRLGEVSIHRAWQWSKQPLQQQLERLWHRQEQRGVRKTIRQLISQHRLDRPSPILAVGALVQLLQEVDESKAQVVNVAVIETPGKGIFITKELFCTLKSQQELPLECATNNR